MKLNQAGLRLAAAGLVLCQLPLRAVDFHAATAQDLQNALTLSAANGADDNIYLTNGYYVGNFNFNSSEAKSLTLLPEPGLTNTSITIDGAGTGRSMSLACTAAANITVTNLAFLRNCGSTANAALRISTVGADVSVGGCRFLGSTNHAGIGLEIVSGRNATVRNCTVSRTGTATGNGVSIAGITAEVHVENNIVSGGTSYGQGIVATSQGTIWLSGNTVMGNSGGNGGGAYCSGPAVILSNNTFTANSSSGTYYATGGGRGRVLLRHYYANR